MKLNLRSRYLPPVVAASTTIAYTCAVAWLARSQSHFVGDDLTNFYQAETLPAREFLLLPSEAHLSPLHRLATLTLYHAAPWNFDAALVVLVATQLVGVLYLYKLVRLLWGHPLAAWLAAWYGCNVFLGFQLLWWASASHRLPYATLSIVSVYHYWRFRSGGRRRSLVYSYAAFVGALGFFVKGLLVAPVLVGMELCEYDRPGRGAVRPRIVLIASMAITGAAAAIATWQAVGGDGGFPSLPARSGHALGVVATKLFYGCFGMLSRFGAGYGEVVFAAVVLAALLWSLATSRRHLARSTVFLAVVVLLNVIMPLMAARSAPWLLVAAEHPRYLYEVYFGIAIAIALLASRSAVAERRRVASQPVAGSTSTVALAVLLIVYAATSFRSFDRARLAVVDRGRARTYLTNLIRDLDELAASRDSTIRIASGRVPRYVTIGPTPAKLVGELSTFLPLLDPRVRVVEPLRADYRVSENGRLVRVDPHS